MERTIIIQTMIKYLKDKEKVDYDEILKYIHNNEIAGCKLNNTIEINDCIFDLIVEGILKVGIVYSYTDSSYQYYIDKDKLMNKIRRTNLLAS